jgi:hypothetical protein
LTTLPVGGRRASRQPAVGGVADAPAKGSTTPECRRGELRVAVTRALALVRRLLRPALERARLSAWRPPLLVGLLARGRRGLQLGLGLAQPVQPPGPARRRRGSSSHGHRPDDGPRPGRPRRPAAGSRRPPRRACCGCGWPCRRRGLRAGAVQCDGADPDILAAHSFSDTTRKPASAVWWRTRKRAIVTWSGAGWRQAPGRRGPRCSVARSAGRSTRRCGRRTAARPTGSWGRGRRARARYHGVPGTRTRGRAGRPRRG